MLCHFLGTKGKMNNKKQNNQGQKPWLVIVQIDQIVGISIGQAMSQSLPVCFDSNRLGSGFLVQEQPQFVRAWQLK